MSLAQRSIRSATWNSFTNLIALPVNFIQSILLARLLPVEYFGIFAAMSSLISFSGTFFEFGFNNAYLHRSPEVMDEDQATSSLFTLRLVFDSVWLITLLLFAIFALDGVNRITLVVLASSGFLTRLTIAPRMLLVRRVQHRRNALLDLVVAFSTTLISVLVAFYTRSIWALLVSSIVAMVIGIIGFYFWKPIWKPGLRFEKPIIRYFMKFGSRNMVNNAFDSALDNVDNLWTSFYLGNLLLGYYSRAFKFAIYPRMVLSAPVNAVAVGTYSELKFDRHGLSRAFFQVNAFLIRAGFLLAGWLAMIAPHFIRLLIGERWLPMLDAFRLMLVFAMLDPIKVTISSVLMAVGAPQKITIVRVTQILVLAIGFFTLGFRYEIAGVALSMDLMVIIGTTLSLYFVHSYVDFSLTRLFSAPLVALLTGIGLNALLTSLWAFGDSDWLAFAVKTLLFGAVYFGMLIALEGRDLYKSFSEILDLAGIVQKARALFGS
jgi:O-antigen/teichoic acid export membrane protein